MMRVTIGNGQILGAREAQEDYFASTIIGDSHLLVLADGMGGHDSGDVASELVVKAVVDYFHLHWQAGTSKHADFLLDTLQFANQQFALAKGNHNTAEGMGTTLIILLLSGQRVFWLSVGDSLLFHRRGKTFRRVNRLHTYSDDLQREVEAGTMSAAEAAKHPDRQAITSAVMGDEIKRVDCPRDGLAIESGDYFLLASDGLESLSFDETVRITQKSAKPQVLVDRLLDCVERKQDSFQDNCTLVLVGVDQAGKRRRWQLWLLILLILVAGYYGFDRFDWFGFDWTQIIEKIQQLIETDMPETVPQSVTETDVPETMPQSDIGRNIHLDQ